MTEEQKKKKMLEIEKKKKKAEERSKKQILEIKAIEFDWIFNKTQGVKFLKALS